MSEHNIRVKDLSRTEKVIVTLGAGALTGALALGAVAGVNKARQPNPLDGTHREGVSVTFGDQANTEIGMADYLQKLTNTPDTNKELVVRMDALDPDQNHEVDQGQEMTVPVDVLDNHK